jgi:hypothetical protein
VWIVGLFGVLVLFATLVVVVRLRPQRFRLAASIAKLVTVEVEMGSEPAAVQPTVPPP